ncbi:MAG: sodium:calcium antiporter [Acidimicrobiia bacterium]
MLLIGTVLVVVAAALLWLGAELFVENASAAGSRLGVTGLAVGLLLAGAEPEELITAIIAALRGQGGIAAGDAIGANITMLTLVVGLAAILRPLPIGGRVRQYLVGASGLGLVAALLMPGGVSTIEGLVLVMAYIAAVAFVWLRERRPPAIGEVAELGEGESAVVDGKELGWRGLALAVTGIGIMALGGWVAVIGAEDLVETLGVAQSVVGLSIVAMATTAELFALAFSAHKRDLSELAVAGVVGSAGYNATVTLGGAALARPLGTSGITGAAWLAAGLPLLILALGGRRGRLTRMAAVPLLLIYGIYIVVLYT